MSVEFKAVPIDLVPADEIRPEPLKLPRSREARRDVSLPAVAMFGDDSAASVTVLNLSYDGCRIESALALLPGAHFTLSVLGLGRMPAYVRWYSHGFAGLSFTPDPIENTVETPRAHFRAALKAKILLRRSGRKNYVVQTTDVSPSGCRVEFVDRPSEGERHWIKFDGLDALEGEVRWVKGFSAGLQFVRPIYPAVFDLLLTKFAKSTIDD